MASMAYSSVFSTPLPMFTQAKLQWGSDSSFIPFLKASSNFVSSKSAFFQLGFSIQSSNITGLVSKSRYFPVVYARAATEKSIHDFTVKVKKIHIHFPYSVCMCVVDIQLCFLWVLITIFVWCVLLNLVVHLMTVY